jgi:hypothetical protein
VLKAVMNAVVGRLEKRYGYDAGYLHELIDIDPAAFFAFSGMQRLSGYRKAPPEALTAAKLVATLTEDCGPCTQIVVSMAEEEGVSSAVIKGVLTGDEAAMGPDAALAWKFARASLARDMEAADPLRDEIVRRWGKKALAAISLGIAYSRVFPSLKYALGHGQACSKIQVRGEPVAPMAA